MATVQQSNKAANRYERFVRDEISRAVRRVRFLDVAKAALGLLIAVMAYGLVMIFADKWLVLSESTRQIGLIAFIAFAGLYSWFVLLRPIRRAINPYYAAIQVEQMIPDAKNSLINWLDLHEHNLPPGASAAIGQRAAHDLEEANLEEAIRSNSLLWLAGIAFGLVVGVVATFMMMRSDQFASLVDRAFSPFSHQAIVKQTRITVLEPAGGNKTLSVGSVGAGTTIEIQVDGRVPKENQPDSLRVRLRHSDDKTDVVEKRLQVIGNDLSHWSIKLNKDDILTGVWYQVLGGDDETEEYRISVQSSPMIDHFTVRRVYRPYLRFVPVEREYDDPNIEDRRGTEITLDVYTNRNIAHREDKAGLPKATLHWEGNGPLNPSIGEPTFVPGHLDAVRFQFVLDQSGQYRISFTTTDNETSNDPRGYRVVAIQDRAPIVQFTKPEQIDETRIAADKSGTPEKAGQGEAESDLMVPADGMLRLEGIATDDIGIRKMTLRMKLEGEELKPQQYMSEDAFRLDTGGWMNTIQYKDAVDLTKLQRTSGQPVQPRTGDRLEFWLEAEDNCDYPGPQVGSTRHHFAKMFSPNVNKDMTPDEKKAKKEEQEKDRDNAKADQKERDQKHEKDREKQSQEDKSKHDQQEKDAKQSGKQDQSQKKNGDQAKGQPDKPKAGQENQSNQDKTGRDNPKPGEESKSDQEKAGAHQQQKPGDQSKPDESKQNQQGGAEKQPKQNDFSKEQQGSQPKAGEQPKDNPNNNKNDKQSDLDQKMKKAAEDIQKQQHQDDGSNPQKQNDQSQKQQPPSSDKNQGGEDQKNKQKSDPSNRDGKGGDGNKDANQSESNKEGTKDGNNSNAKPQTSQPPKEGGGQSNADKNQSQKPADNDKPMTGNGNGQKADPKSQPDQKGNAQGTPQNQPNDDKSPKSTNPTPQNPKAGSGGQPPKNDKDNASKDTKSNSGSKKKDDAKGTGEDDKSASSEPGNAKPKNPQSPSPAKDNPQNPMGNNQSQGNQNQGKTGTPKDSQQNDPNAPPTKNPKGTGGGTQDKEDPNKNGPGEPNVKEKGDANGGKDEIAKAEKQMRAGTEKERQEAKEALSKMAKNDADPEKRKAAEEALKKAEKEQGASGNGSPKPDGKEPKPGEMPDSSKSPDKAPKPGDPTQPGKENPGSKDSPQANKDNTAKSDKDGASPNSKKSESKKGEAKDSSKGSDSGKSPSPGKPGEAKEKSESNDGNPSKPDQPKPGDGAKAGGEKKEGEAKKPQQSDSDKPMTGDSQPGKPMGGSPMSNNGQEGQQKPDQSNSSQKKPGDPQSQDRSNETTPSNSNGTSSNKPNTGGGGTPPDNGKYTPPDEASKKRSGDLELEKVDRQKLKEQFLKNGGTNEEWDQYWREVAKQKAAEGQKNTGTKDVQTGSRNGRSFMNDGVKKVEGNADANPGQLQSGSTGNAPAEYRDAAAKFAELLGQPQKPKEK